MTSTIGWMGTAWLRRMHRSMESAWRALGAGSEGARMIERDGVLAAVVPAVPERSVFNSVLYDTPEHLAAARDELARAYADAGVNAWTVWVPATDAASAELLASAGHRLDATPRAMVLDLDELPRHDPGALDWSRHGTVAELTRVNDLAYGDAPGTFALGIGDPPAGAWRIYEARLDGRVASVLATTDTDGDCGVWWVATVPEARGRGLSRDLVRMALDEARPRGMRTSTLQATKMGFPVYERIGYRDIGELQMWELRRQ
ncbi:MAG TPA: GNAT family N-acetyltransferase [Solirubrobacterales bacterium]|nr:GNAT family N-acetyltransferase [Solirubrobacterales bacterium]